MFVRRQGSCALTDGDSQAARLLSPNLRFGVVAGASTAASDRTQSAFTHRGPRPLPVLVGAGEQQRPQSVDLSGAGDGQLVSRTEQDADCFPIPVAAGQGFPVFWHAQDFECGKSGIAGIGFAASPSAAARAFDLDDRDPGGAQCPREPDPVASGAFEPHYDSWARCMFGGPGQRLGESRGVVGDRQCRECRAVRGGHLQCMGVAVGVAADDGVHTFCQHGHGPSRSFGCVGQGRHRPGANHPTAYL